jgi:alpha-glucosidase
VPLPWTRTGPSLGFSSGSPWLPQPASWSELSVEAEEADNDSMLWLYRDALRLRRELPELHRNEHGWLDLGGQVIALTRGDGFACVVNFGEDPIDLPAGRVLLSSQPISDNLPTDCAAWIALS